MAGRFWGDLLPWQLAMEFCQDNPCGLSGLETLTANLDHHNASIRRWMFDLAWCVRDRLNPVEAYARLFKNVANTLGHWQSALGLCRAFFPTDEIFWSVADGFAPENFGAQYAERLAFARKHGLPASQLVFEQMELRVRRKISDTSLGLTPEEIKIVEGSDVVSR